VEDIRGQVHEVAMSFNESTLSDQLYSFADAKLNAAPFGIIGFDSNDERVQLYSDAECALSGLSRTSVLGRALFDEVAPCMNNFLVAEKFRSGQPLDEIVDYVFTLRMRPTPVRLRLIWREGQSRKFLCVEKVG